VIGQLRGLRAADKQLDLWQRETIARARQQGASWSEIGEALGVSKQAAWKLYNDDVRELLAEIRQRSRLSDDEAQQLADDERAARAGA
jgi:IS30 family transposase